MSAQDQGLLDAARARYAELRKVAEYADILPELYLATILLGLGQTDQAIPILEGAAVRCDDCAAARRYLDSLR